MAESIPFQFHHNRLVLTAIASLLLFSTIAQCSFATDLLLAAAVTGSKLADLTESAMADPAVIPRYATVPYLGTTREREPEFLNFNQNWL
jgi:hypothetical protein